MLKIVPRIPLTRWVLGAAAPFSLCARASVPRGGLPEKRGWIRRPGVVSQQGIGAKGESGARRRKR